MKRLEKCYIGFSFLPWVLFIVLSRTDGFDGENIFRIITLSLILSGMGLSLIGFAIYRKRQEPIVPLVMGTIVASSYFLLFGSLFGFHFYII